MTLFTGKDLLFCGGYLATYVLPPRLDRWWVGWLASLFLRLQREQVRRLAHEMAVRLGPRLNGRDPARLAEERFCLLIEDRWGQLRALCRRRWEPAITLEGLEHVQAARRAGRGVILWGMSMGSGLVHKQGLWRGGVQLAHLSGPRHAIVSNSAFSIRVLAPMRWRSEMSYLAERVVIPPDGSLGYLRRLGEWLQQNGCVSIMGEHAGRRNVAAAVLGMTSCFALGAPSLAWRHGAALLTVYAAREGRFRYRVVIEKAMDVDRSLERKKFAEAAVQEFAARLERRVAEQPAAWEGWEHGRL
jgi:lauroyl/myristoyl acyltransferase